MRASRHDTNHQELQRLRAVRHISLLLHLLSREERTAHRSLTATRRDSGPQHYPPPPTSLPRPASLDTRLLSQGSAMPS